ncbi:hemerythrin domain-containing protein [Streptomyces sp. NPDC020766]|uniref:hemerythrin domain-containing protein n=1 Tax=Streptomyces sp. NPDC020766 TaxID=3155011 RepID=UPI00340CC839
MPAAWSTASGCITTTPWRTAPSPVFERRYPEIAPVIERLREEHRQVAAGLDRLTRLVESDDGQDVNWLRGELERTVVGIDEHFVYEETYLLPALGVTPPGPTS